MRRIDVWVGRAVAIVGLVYVLLASLWPLTASAGSVDPSTGAATSIAVEDSSSTVVDLQLVKVLADVSARVNADIGATGADRRRARRALAASTIATTPESWAMLLVAAAVFCAAAVATLMRSKADARFEDRSVRSPATARSACRRRLEAAA